MQLWEAIKVLQEGKKVRLKHWTPNEFIHLNSNRLIIDEKGDRFSLGPFNHNFEFDREWEIYEEPEEKTYTFMEAFNLLRNRNRIKRKKWGDSQLTIYSQYDKAIFQTNLDGRFIQFYPVNFEDMDATDWVVV